MSANIEMADEIEMEVSTDEPEAFRNTPKDSDALRTARKMLRLDRLSAGEMDALYRRVLATPNQYYYTEMKFAEWRLVMDTLTGDNRGNGSPLFAAVLKNMIQTFLKSPATRERGLGLLTLLARVSGHMNMNLVDMYRKLAQRFDFTLRVTPEAEQFAGAPKVANNTLTVGVTDDGVIVVRMNQIGGAVDQQYLAALRAQRTALQARLEQLRRDHAQATYEVRPTTDRFVGAETSHMRSEYAHPGLPRTSSVRLPKRQRAMAPASTIDVHNALSGANAARTTRRNTKSSIRDIEGRIKRTDGAIANLERQEAAETMMDVASNATVSDESQAAATLMDMSGRGALMSRRADAEPETPRERRALPPPDTPEGRELSAMDRKLHQLVAAVYTGGSLAGYDTEQTKQMLLVAWDQMTKWLAGRDLDVEDLYYGSMSPEHLDAALGIASSPSQTGQGLDHMREMLGSGARRKQRLQHISQAVEMRGSGAPSTRPAAQVLQISAARVTRKAVTGNPHAGASAPTIIAGTGLIAPAPGYHYMATGELMKDPE